MTDQRQPTPISAPLPLIESDGTVTIDGVEYELCELADAVLAALGDALRDWVVDRAA